MIKEYIRTIDGYSKNIFIVFIGTAVANVFHLLCQLFIAHALSPADFAAFNALLSIFVLVSTPLFTLQTATAKYSSEFNSHKQNAKTRLLFTRLLKRVLPLSALTFLIGYFLSWPVMDKLKIVSFHSSYILALLLAVSWLTPVVLGGLQGLELFGWFSFVSILGGLVKVACAFIFLNFGFAIAGALGAFLAGSLIAVLLGLFVLRKFLSVHTASAEVDFKGFYLYLIPVAVNSFCYALLTNLDMVMVKYYFSPADSGIYSLAQMAGKIFLFLPMAISLVMLPRTSGLSAQRMDTVRVLKRSLVFAALLSGLAALCYNLWPLFVLRALTGKVFPDAITLGRLFSLSMTSFSLLFVIVTYFLSIRDLRFIKYLVGFCLLQFLGIVFFHASLIQVQLVLCVCSILVFIAHLFLLKKQKR
jgi:O-antigen/teichoic acid export membrane protein